MLPETFANPSISHSTVFPHHSFTNIEFALLYSFVEMSRWQLERMRSVALQLTRNSNCVVRHVFSSFRRENTQNAILNTSYVRENHEIRLHDEILWMYTRKNTRQRDTIEFSRLIKRQREARSTELPPSQRWNSCWRADHLQYRGNLKINSAIDENLGRTPG